MEVTIFNNQLNLVRIEVGQLFLNLIEDLVLNALSSLNETVELVYIVANSSSESLARVEAQRLDGYEYELSLRSNNVLQTLYILFVLIVDDLASFLIIGISIVVVELTRSVVLPCELQTILLHVVVLCSKVVVQVSNQVSERLLAGARVTVAVSPNSLQVSLELRQIELCRNEVLSLLTSVSNNELVDIVVGTCPTPVQNIRCRTTILSVNVTNSQTLYVLTSGVSDGDVEDLTTLSL